MIASVVCMLSVFSQTVGSSRTTLLEHAPVAQRIAALYSSELVLRLRKPGEVTLMGGKRSYTYDRGGYTLDQAGRVVRWRFYPPENAVPRDLSDQDRLALAQRFLRAAGETRPLRLRHFFKSGRIVLSPIERGVPLSGANAYQVKTDQDFGVVTMMDLTLPARSPRNLRPQILGDFAMRIGLSEFFAKNPDAQIEVVSPPELAIHRARLYLPNLDALDREKFEAGEGILCYGFVARIRGLEWMTPGNYLTTFFYRAADDGRAIGAQGTYSGARNATDEAPPADSALPRNWSGTAVYLASGRRSVRLVRRVEAAMEGGETVLLQRDRQFVSARYDAKARRIGFGPVGARETWEVR